MTTKPTLYDFLLIYLLMFGALTYSFIGLILFGVDAPNAGGVYGLIGISFLLATLAKLR